MRPTGRWQLGVIQTPFSGQTVGYRPGVQRHTDWVGPIWTIGCVGARVPRGLISRWRWRYTSGIRIKWRWAEHQNGYLCQPP